MSILTLSKRPLLNVFVFSLKSFRSKRLICRNQGSFLGGWPLLRNLMFQENIEVYKDVCDFVLIMTTTPGKSGGKFPKENFQRIREFRNKFPGKEIEVDGGVNAEVGFILRMLGVQSVVSGSYLVNHESVAEALLHLRSSIIHSEFTVKDFMMSRAYAPIVNINSPAHAIIQTIENYKMGFAIIEDDQQNLVGISSNADLRRGILKRFEKFGTVTSERHFKYFPSQNHRNVYHFCYARVHSVKEIFNLLFAGSQ